ncbi:hypothetical protein DSL72_004814 [Monilinia vaccinii-corymbosi]|uniref:YDG domain-containing protein n=1 Tax=Monilinia vaccinii-corymbosi TaxID=61207 RepID=A0A8A3P071_9HELO|nr:hypothetical protein DSL72_004814 [Monilinia vaccinii-corymbosi]
MDDLDENKRGVALEAPSTSSCGETSIKSELPSGPITLPEQAIKDEEGTDKIEKIEGDEDEKSDVLSTTPQFDLQDAIAKLVGSNFTASDIHHDPAKLLNQLKELKKSAVSAAVRCRRDENPSPQQWRDSKLFLYTLSSLTTTTPAVVTPKLRHVKELFLRSVLGLFTSPSVKFPNEYALIAQELIDRIEAHNGFETPSPSPQPDTNNLVIRKRKSTDDETSRAGKKNKKDSTSSSSAMGHPPPPNHPIWGDHSVMRGMYLNENGVASIYPGTKAIFKKKFDRYGHNGLTVGDCWPSQLTALRDGAHGASQGGISGDKTLGAYSIVISSHYEGFDLDEGHSVRYSAPRAKETNAKEADSLRHGTQCMRQSLASGNPVRVLRNHSCAWKGRPSMGIRYDGLYQVVECETQRNGKGGKFWRFTLTRLPDQDPIKANHPSAALMTQFERIKDAY